MLPPTSKPDQGPWADYSITIANAARKRRYARLERLASQKTNKSHAKRQHAEARKQLIQDALERTRKKHQ